MSLREIEYDVDWTEKFIREIRSRPAIYNKDLSEHTDRELINSYWTEICETMIPAWPDLTEYEKSAKARDLRAKWRNLKTCFRRELNNQERGTVQSSKKRKRRKYVYFDNLMFLSPAHQEWVTISEYNNSPSDMCKQDENSEISEDDFEVVETVNEIDPLNNTFKCDTSIMQIFQPLSNPPTAEKKNEECLLLGSDLEKVKKEDIIDEDKLFLLSLLPSFRKLDAAQKMDAKIEFLSTLKRFLPNTTKA